MRFSIAQLLLLNVLVAGLRLPIPRPPKAPSSPRPGNALPGQSTDPGRWTPGKAPDAPQTQPGRLPVDMEQPKPACNGKKRMDCAIDTSKWDQLNAKKPEFRNKGAAEMARLDRIKENPTDADPKPLDQATFEERFRIDVNVEQQYRTEIGERLLGHKKDDKWTKFSVTNREDKVEELIAKMKAKGVSDVNGKPLDEIEDLYLEDPFLFTYANVERKSIVVPHSYNSQYDIYRSYDGVDNKLLIREGLDETQALRWTDEVMYGWRQALSKAGKDVKDVELESVIRHGIVTEDTTEVINALMARVGKRLDSIDNKDKNEDFFKINKDDPDPRIKEGFETIAGTIHGQRVAQMLREYVSFSLVDTTNLATL
jgi:hypothetical protein